jgi:Tfp pilus assembly protein PilN
MKAVNLIPGEQRQGAGGISDLTGRSGGAALILLGVVVGLAVMIAMYGSAHHSISSQNGEVAEIKADTSAVEARTGRLTPYTNFVSMADQRTETVAQLVQARFDWSHVLRELGRVLPAGTSLNALHGTVGAAGATSSTTASTTAATSGTTPASSTPPGSTPVFTLTGCATSQTVVAQALQRLRLMDGASEVQLQSSTKAETGGASGASGGSGATGSCSGSDPSFTTQVTFVGLPAAPATSVPTAAGAATASAHSAGATEPVSAGGPSK